MSTDYQPLVSVIMPTYNGSKYIAESIESALAQTYPSVELIVVDDGSTDDTTEVVRRYGDRVTLLQQKNGGTAAARNFGIAHAHGELIALLDHDDLWLPNKLERQIPVFAESPRVGMVHTGARWFQTETHASTSEVIPALSLDYHDLLAWCLVSCCTVMFTRKAFDEAGPFDASLLGTDDWDMWIRIAALYEVRGVTDILSEVRLHGNNQGSNAERTYTHCMHVVSKPRNAHQDCPQCRAALKSAAAGVKSDYHTRMCHAARQALNERKLALAVRLRLRGLARNPAALTALPARLLRKLQNRTG
jgi:glycosyltransferase involved in cell wall biosynthesis